MVSHRMWQICDLFLQPYDQFVLFLIYLYCLRLLLTFLSLFFLLLFSNHSPPFSNRCFSSGHKTIKRHKATEGIMTFPKKSSKTSIDPIFGNWQQAGIIWAEKHISALKGEGIIRIDLMVHPAYPCKIFPKSTASCLQVIEGVQLRSWPHVYFFNENINGEASSIKEMSEESGCGKMVSLNSLKELIYYL